MKSGFSAQTLVVFAAVVWCGPMVAQTNAPTPASSDTPATAPASETPPVQLSYGVPEVLKLVHAKVSDGVITAFIKSSGRIYRLSVAEILYLREQGVSDAALTAMLDSGKNVPATVA